MTSRTSFPQIQSLRLPSMRETVESSVPSPIPVHRLVNEGPWRLTQSDGLVLLHGHPAVLQLGLCAAVDRSLTGEPLFYLDGANSFDPFLIGSLTRAAWPLPHAILPSIHLSRAFTCRQMVQLVTERLGPALRDARASAIILSGPLEPFYDETVPAAKAVRLAQVLFASLRLLVGQGCRILCLCPPPSLPRRGHLLEALRRRADRVIDAVESHEGLLLRERRAGVLSSWRIPLTY
ncbi:MAG: hypothetical protein KGI53_06300 [Nitrospirota bacterium]|nr:hypothetical protein [Nitrospirota bacterium]